MRAVQVRTRDNGKRPKPDDMYVADVSLPKSERGFVGPNDLLIKVGAAGINRPDVLQRMGAYPAPKGRQIRYATLPCLHVESLFANDTQYLVQKQKL